MSTDNSKTNLSAQIESLRLKLTPIAVKATEDSKSENKLQKNLPPNLLGVPNRRPNLNLPITPTQPTNDLTSEDTRKKYDEVIKNSGLFVINNERKRVEQVDFVKDKLLGSGTCGEVYKMQHKPSGTLLAMKVMPQTASEEENKRIKMDLDVLVKSFDCPNIVRCFGYFIGSTDVWICMELMACCFGKLLKLIQQPIPELILGKLTCSTINALNYLKEKHGIMHRDIKPSNILIDQQGNIKLCDFGISGFLIDSRARSRNFGSTAYMSPERIEPSDPQHPDYDIRADIWSLGISLIELATNVNPYKDCRNDFDVMSCIVTKSSPKLPDNSSFSDEFRDFVTTCLIKDYHQRPKYGPLKLHAFFTRSSEESVDVANWYRNVTATFAQSPK